MGTILLFGFLTGLDNFQVAAGLGVVPMDKRRKTTLVCAFAFFEALMPFIGMTAGQWLVDMLPPQWAQWELVSAMCVAVCGIAIIWQGLPWRDMAKLPPWTNQGYLVLPLMLSLDNLLAGVGLGALGYPVLMSSIMVGLCSGCLCFAGLWVGARVQDWLPKQAYVVGGIWLLCVACSSLFID